MTMDSQAILQKVDAHLVVHPNATLQSAAESLGIARQEIEQALSELEGASFQEFRENRRLARALKHLASSDAAVTGPWEKQRTQPRIIIPKTAVKYHIRSFWIHNRHFSNLCPLIDLSSGGLAFLTDNALKIGICLSMLLKLAGEEEMLQLEGHVVYVVATGIAGYRYRIGIKFLPFNDRRGFNTLKALNLLKRLEN